jgi:tetratricopeptide (TPR) repeat protein
VIAWARAELPNEAEESQWHFCTGMVLQSCEELDAALSKYRQATDVKPGFWRAWQQTAITLGNKGENQDAISTMNELIERENWRLDSDEQYAKEYWDNMLPTIVTLNLRLKENTAAEGVSKKIVERIMKQDSFNSSAQLDVKTLMEIQVKQRKHSELVQLLEELSVKIDLEGNWLIKMMYNFHSEDEFHNTLLDIGKNTNYSAKITELYQAAIDGAISTTSTVSKDLKVSLPMRLRALQARVMWHLGAEEQRHAALSTWEELLRTVPDEEDINFRNMIWSRRIAVRQVRFLGKPPKPTVWSD